MGFTRPGRIASASRPGRVSSGLREADMTVSVRDARNTEGDRLWIQSVYRDYLDDLAPGAGTGTFPALGEVGHREPDQLFHWFGDPNRFPLVILRSSEPVGFALVVRGAMGAGPQRGAAASPQARAAIDYRMAEFFITRARRRLGIGATAVRLIFSRFTGRWEITEYLRNASAVSFWRRVVASYTRGNYLERIVNGEVRQTFESG
jgi:predicted acetyltransferase